MAIIVRKNKKLFRQNFLLTNLTIKNKVDVYLAENEENKKMLKKILSMSLIVLLANLALAPSTIAKDKESKEAEFIEKLQTNIRKQGVGINSKIKLKLKDGTKIEGFVTESNDEQFVVTDSKTGQSIPVTYPQVRQAKGNNQGNSWSARNTISVVIAVGIFAALIIAVATAKN